MKKRKEITSEKEKYKKDIIELLEKIEDPYHLFKIYHFALGNYHWEQEHKGKGAERVKKSYEIMEASTENAGARIRRKGSQEV